MGGRCSLYRCGLGSRLLPEGGWALPQPMPQPRGAWPAGPLQGFCTPCLSWVEAVWLL